MAALLAISSRGLDRAQQSRCVARDVTNRDNAGRQQASHLSAMCARQLQAYSTVLADQWLQQTGCTAQARPDSCTHVSCRAADTSVPCLPVHHSPLWNQNSASSSLRAVRSVESTWVPTPPVPHAFQAIQSQPNNTNTPHPNSPADQATPRLLTPATNPTNPQRLGQHLSSSLAMRRHT